MPPRSAAALGLLIASVVALYSIGLDQVPPYLHDAEVQFALHARAIASTAHDTNGRFLPVYFQMPAIGENVWFHPVIVYMTAAVLTLVPLSEASVRFATVLVAVLNIGLLYLVVRRMRRRADVALLAAFMLALTPAHFIHARLAMDYLHPVPFILGWLLCVLRFEAERRMTDLYLAAVILGLGVYSYIASVALMPLYLVMTLIYAWHADVPWRRLLTVAAAFGAVLLPAMAWLATHPTVASDTFSRYSTGSSFLGSIASRLADGMRWARVQEWLAVYWDFFDPAYLFFAGGANYMNSTRTAGVFLIPFAVLLVVGLHDAAVKRRTAFSTLLVAGLLTAPLPATAVGERYAIDRHLGTLPFAVLLAVCGWTALYTSRRLVVRLAALTLLLLMPLQFASFYRDYLGDYRVRAAGAFEFNIRGAAEALIAHAPAHPRFFLSRKIPYARHYWRFYTAKAGVEWFDEQTSVIDADTFDVAHAPQGSLFMAHVDDLTLAELARRGALRLVRRVPELEREPLFVVYQR
jgi:4-amino-4-deoxy-L-arabinose transferase-like glycosyltransferase